MNITDQQQGPASAGSNGLARIERTFSNLFNLVKAREKRPNQLRQQNKARQTRSEAFKEVQREKWLGVRTITVAEPQPPRPRDLHKRILQDPNQ
ncbi:MAG: hypothetical protein ABI589_13075 [Burkholderiales bacterium]